MCLYSKIIKNKKFTANKKNGGVIPTVNDERTLYVPVGCGNCMECRKQKANGWRVRLMEEIKHKKNGIFVTLTFSNESIIEITKSIRKLSGYELDNEIATKAIRRFLERWRKKYKKSVHHWMITELGHNGTENIHLHGIIWTDIDPEEIRKLWKYGFVWLSTENKGYVNEETINYIVKYVTKKDDKHTEYKSKILCSNNIGKGYIGTENSKKNRYNGDKTIETYRTKRGMKIGLPVYYRNKIYTDEEREKLWITKLNEQIRWVDGIKVDISKNENEYYKLLKEAQKKNKKLKFGSSKINWEKRKYENERRNIMYKKRGQKS